QKSLRSADGVGRCEAATALLVATERQVIVLDENGVVETGAMIGAAAAMDGVFFEASPAGRGFSCVVKTCLRAGDRFDVLPCQRRDPRQATEQVKDRPLAG